ncbi:hypothetical protein Deipr_1726 [Deinococcus proteolyticus MRP]|uniref:Lipoprotein n=1 Tax=Deinococcus proteolyticus (strain ATCC 35074 / DSM 20540 / JCM 6276 / NBRC 101906 / NCIMB 13154 / VKM Ac-1939 / CCM 2703 / MRP) TaxID=693977 RepID=F0RL67_DEIPM|nr:hypothetical protein [Deinococcus proteolyticus]ADY26859.1 hypothetical protein Deipr_1726 [Deinococcus proteolyticus MRP]
MPSHLPALPTRLRPLLVSAAMLPLLAACQSAPRLPADHDLSGTISGEWREDANLRLNLVGAGFPQTVTNTSNLAQNKLAQPQGGWQYGVDLPAAPNVVGAYQVIAFDDINNDAQYDVGEPFARNNQFLIFSLQPGEFAGYKSGEWLNIPPLKVNRGWNLYDASLPVGNGNPRSMERLTDYNLHRAP